MKSTQIKWKPFPFKLLAYAVGSLIFCSQAQANDLATDLDISGETYAAELVHIEQSALNLLNSTDPLAAFHEAFEVGDELFEEPGNELDGIGANVGDGERFAKFPRMDLNGPEQWANHTPERVTGPNAQACTDCHFTPFNDGAGPASANNVRDPLRQGNFRRFITRQPPHVFGIGAKQRLAEEMTADLHQIRSEAITEAAVSGQAVTKNLEAKGVSFGQILVNKNGKIDNSMIEGVDDDLIVKPLQWKGSDLTIRSFVRGAGNNELGLQATELVGDVDGDFDGVINELGVGDITALTIYQAGQPRPVTKTELNALGRMDLVGLPGLSPEEIAEINAGENYFSTAGCASCHVPTLYLNDSMFSEPSQSPTHRDVTFPSGADPAAHGLTPANAVTFDLAADMLDNIIISGGGDEVNLGNFKTDGMGTIVNIFSDLKRHDLGEEVAEPVDEVGTGASVFITQPLWGAGSTPPYMHDGRSPSIVDAIQYHGGEAADSRTAFNALTPEQRLALVAYIENNILLLAEEE